MHYCIRTSIIIVGLFGPPKQLDNRKLFLLICGPVYEENFICKWPLSLTTSMSTASHYLSHQGTKIRVINDNIFSPVQHRHHCEPGRPRGEGDRAEEDGGRSRSELPDCAAGLCCHENRESGRLDSQGRRHGGGEGAERKSELDSWLILIIQFHQQRSAAPLWAFSLDK